MGRENNKPYWKVLTDVSKIVKKLEKKWKNHYNVYVYSSVDYPPEKKDRLGFSSNFF